MKKINAKHLIGIFVLSIVAGIVVRASVNGKFRCVSNLYYSSGGQCIALLIGCTSTCRPTTGGTGLQATLRSTSTAGTNFKLYSTFTCSPSRAIHFHA
jgi:hypothetical protein